jgi:glycosyltransferase involved in cell wall biosynthesis
VLDAYATGVPVLASNRGGLPELVTDGSVLRADDPDAWARALGELWEDPARRGELGEQVLERARDRLGEDRYYDRLIDIYANLRGGD